MSTAVDVATIEKAVSDALAYAARNHLHAVVRLGDVEGNDYLEAYEGTVTVDDRRIGRRTYRVGDTALQSLSLVVQIRTGGSIPYQHPTYYRGQVSLREPAEIDRANGYVSIGYVNEQPYMRFRRMAEATTWYEQHRVS